MISQLASLLLLTCSLFVGAQSGEGFVPLFDGKTLTGWTGKAKQFFVVESGCLVCQKGCSGNLLTQREYGDFVLRFDFKICWPPIIAWWVIEVPQASPGSPSRNWNS